MPKIILKRGSGFQWISGNNIHVIGYLFDPEGNFYKNDLLPEYFLGIESAEEFKHKVAEANGIFSVIIEKEDRIWLATDIIRSLPLFYTWTEEGWIVADQAKEITDLKHSAKLNHIAQKEFKGTGYVTGCETLIEGLEQLQAGEIVELGDKVRREFYYSYRLDRPSHKSYEELRIEGINVFERTFERMIQSLNGRTAVVPLSGGFDSRLIAVMLKKAGYEKIICFSYGRKDNHEAEISEKVAEKLGFKWYFIEYSEELIKDFVESKAFTEYYQWAGNFTSMFFMQEYFAVQEMKVAKLIPEDAIFIPGHSGDFLGGSQFTKHGFSAEQESTGTIVNRIFDVKYHYATYNQKDAGIMKLRIQEQLEENSTGKNALAYSIHEDWDMKEKLAKFNGNSNAAYTFFGHEFRFPYWDLELLEFFRTLPVLYKLNKRLYNEILISSYFDPYNVKFNEELQVSEKAFRRSRMKQRVKNILPQFVINIFIKKKDLLCYYEITSQLRDDLIRKQIKPGNHGNKYNKMIIQWYLEILKEQFIYDYF